jgi:6-phosphofructokinase
MHVGAPAPGMNAAVRACVRLALDKGFKHDHIHYIYIEISLFNLNVSTKTKGYRVMAAYNGFKSLLENIDEIEELNWLSVNGYVFKLKKITLNFCSQCRD